MPRILIAEDETRIAAFIAKGLQRAGYDTEIVHDGQQALQRLLAVPFDLLLLDLGMPVLDGWAVLRELRLNKVSTLVVIVTAHSDAMDLSYQQSLGADGYLIKPFRFQELLACIQKHLA